MANGTIECGYEDITSQISWNSTVVQKQALKVGNFLVIRFQATRTAATSTWKYATLPASLAPLDGRWTGVGFNSATVYPVRYYGNGEILTENFTSNAGWIQGQIMIVLNAPAVS